MADLLLFNQEDGCSIRSTFQGIKIKEFILIFVVVVVITFYSPPPCTLVPDRGLVMILTQFFVVFIQNWKSFSS